MAIELQIFDSIDTLRDSPSVTAARTLSPSEHYIIQTIFVRSDWVKSHCLLLAQILALSFVVKIGVPVVERLINFG